MADRWYFPKIGYKKVVVRTDNVKCHLCGGLKDLTVEIETRPVCLNCLLEIIEKMFEIQKEDLKYEIHSD